MKTRRSAKQTEEKSSKSRRTSQRDLAYGVIRRGILLGHHKHGARINERVLAEKLGISRVPVREALLCLHGEGLIRKSKRGLEVTRLLPHEIPHQIEFRATIECAAARLAAERITPAEIERFSELLDEQEILERAGDQEAFHESDLAFHQLILKATRNPFIIRLSGSLAMGSIVGQVSHGGVVDGHRAIFNAIRKGDADLAESLIFEHITKGPYYADEVKS